MKRLQIVAPGRAEWSEHPEPIPNKDEAVVKVHGVTTCPHWDIHILDGEPMFPGMALEYPYYPGQPGHEMTGEVVEVGRHVTELKPGMRVAVWRDSGPTRPGAYSEYVSLPAENLLEVPPELDTSEVASLELAMCVQVSFDRLGLVGGVRGKTVGISGLGPSGLIGVQLAKAHGAERVHAFDPLADRRSLAESLGADTTVDPFDDTSSDQHLDVAIDMTGLPTAISFLIDRTKTAVALFGVVRDDLTFPADRWYGGFTLVGYGEHNRRSAETALECIKSGQLKLAPLVSDTLPFTDYVKAIDLLRNKKAIKILFTP